MPDRDRISIMRTRDSVKQTDCINIELRKYVGGKLITTQAKMNLEDFAKAVTGVGYMPCAITITKTKLKTSEGLNDARYWLDEDGYPTEAAINLIEKWVYTDGRELFEFIKKIWWSADTLFDDSEEHLIKLHTGGWSGNEDIIAAMKKNTMVWLKYWHTSHHGGHYEFDKPK